MDSPLRGRCCREGFLTPQPRGRREPRPPVMVAWLQVTQSGKLKQGRCATWTQRGDRNPWGAGSRLSVEVGDGEQGTSADAPGARGQLRASPPAGKGAGPAQGSGRGRPPACPVWPHPRLRLGAGRPPEGPCRFLPTARPCAPPSCSGLSGATAHTSLLRGDVGRPEGARGGHGDPGEGTEPPARGARAPPSHATAEPLQGLPWGGAPSSQQSPEPASSARPGHRHGRCITWSHVLTPMAQPGKFSVDNSGSESAGCGAGAGVLAGGR